MTGLLGKTKYAIWRKFFVGIISILAFLFLGARIAHAEGFQLSPENQKLLEQVNDMLIKDNEQPLEIIIDGKNVSKKEYWKAKSEEECYLKIDTSTKNIELKQDISDKQLKRNLLRDLNKTQSVNKSLNNFLKDLKDREDKKREIKLDPALEISGFFIIGIFVLMLVVIALLEWIKQDYY